MVDETRDRHESSDFSTGAASDFNLPSTPAVLLPIGWEPGNWDVICQRGKDCQYHVGNRRFRICIENHLDSYINSNTRQEKSAVISSIVSSIKGGNNHAGGFIAMDVHHQRWYYVDNKVARDKVGNALRDAIKQRMPQTGKSNDCMSAFSLESSFFWNDRTPAPQLAGVENPLVDEPSDASNLRIDQPRSYSSNLELPHVPSMAALQIGSGASLGFAFPINARTHPVVPHRSLFTNNLAQWETLDLMDLEPRPLGLLPHEASSMLLSESSMGPGASNVARSPPWCKAMLSGSQINPLDVEKRSSSGSSSDEEEPRWYKSQQT